MLLFVQSSFNENSTLLLLSCLQQQRQCVEVHPIKAETSLIENTERVFRFGSNAKTTTTDHTQGIIKNSIQKLTQRITKLEDDIKHRENEAKRLLLQRQRNSAAIQLKMKHKSTVSLTTAYQQLETLHTLQNSLDEASTQQQVFQAMKQTATTLKEVQKTISIDTIGDVTDELADTLSEMKMTDEALSQPSKLLFGCFVCCLMVSRVR